MALLPFDSADLFVDDAQYWFWGQELAWGYYSKPPLIAWILRLSTAIGSDAPFWIRLPLPLIHAATAVVVALIARRLFGAARRRPRRLRLRQPARRGARQPARLDRHADARSASRWRCSRSCTSPTRRSLGWAVVLGAAVGVGLLAKYAMIYFPLSAALAALLAPARRGSAGATPLVAAAVALAVVAPNLAWNAANEFATLQHTADNADWQRPRASTSPASPSFLAGQFAVAGPVFFAAYLVGARRRDAAAPRATSR